MKTGDLVRQFGVSARTINRWVEEYDKFLSDGAKRLSSHQSVFNESDFAVLATVHQLSTDGFSSKDIQDKLDAGFLIQDVELSSVGYSDGRMVPAASVEQIIDSAELRVEIEGLRRDRERLLDELVRERERNVEKDQRISELQSEIKELQRALGRAEGRLEQIEIQERQQKPTTSSE